MTDDVAEFGARLGACRWSAGLSQEELAERSGLSIRTVSNLERGHTRWPHPKSVHRLADALGLGGEARQEFIAAAERRLAHTNVMVATTTESRLFLADGGLVVDDANHASGFLSALPGEPVTRRAGRSAKQAGLADFSRESLAPAPAWLPVFQLPTAPGDFTGRLAECERIAGVLTAVQDRPGVPVVVVSGLPGSGKTSLALHAAHLVSEQFDDGQLWAHLDGTSDRPRDPAEVLGEFLEDLGVPVRQIPSGLFARAAWFRSRLAGRRVLVVADDAAAVAQVRPLLPGTAGCAMVVTSRSRLEGLDGAHLLPLEVMTAGDAVGMLARIVGEDRLAADPAAAGELVQACGGLPLALRITGAKLATRPSWPLPVMVGKITGAQSRLSVLESAELSVRASIASSYQLLPERHRRAFRLLALLGMADFAEWVVGALLGEADVAEVIRDLADQSLLAVAGADAAGEPRYRLHDLLRDFAAEHLAGEPAASRDAALQRALEGWLQLTRLADAALLPAPCFPPPDPWASPGVIPAAVAQRLTADPVAWFTAERVNLRAAVELACETGRLDLARQLASCQLAFQHDQDRYNDAEHQWAHDRRTRWLGG